MEWGLQEGGEDPIRDRQPGLGGPALLQGRASD